LLLGERAQHGDAVVASRVQTFLVRREQGHVEQVGEAIAGSLGEFPARRSLFGSVLANLHATLGRQRDTSRALDLLGDLGTLPRDNEWLFALSLLSEACALAGDRARAAVLYELLAPYADRLAVDVSDGVNGCISRPLGLLAGALDRPDDAVRHLEDAVELDTAFGTWPWVAHSQYELARALQGRGGRGDAEAARVAASEALERARSLAMPALEEALLPLVS
jgi:tetratricopeptide (TPR) repeat protein